MRMSSPVTTILLSGDPEVPDPAIPAFLKVLLEAARKGLIGDWDFSVKLLVLIGILPPPL